MIINNSLESIGGFNTSLDNYVTKTIFDTRVGSLENVIFDTTNPSTGTTVLGLQSQFTNLLDGIGDLNTLQLSENNINGTLVEEVNIINEKLQW